MIKVAILEYEKETKDIVFALARLFSDVDWTFRYFNKASVLARQMKDESFQLFIFDEMFKTSRLESVFVHDNPSASFIYVCKNPIMIKNKDERSRVHYISKDELDQDLSNISSKLLAQCKQDQLYELDYAGTHVSFPYDDIYYLEKMDKFIYFHTKKGVFHQRSNLKELETLFTPFGFIRTHVSYLVNEKYIVSRSKDEVELINQEKVPLSRAQKKKILAKKRENLIKEPN